MIITSVSGKNYELVIGLEIHAQIKSNAKILSTSSNNWDSEANSNISNMDIAFPGSLPVINIDAVKQAVKTGIAINAQVNEISYFGRKNYFYPDLPSGYQITQFYTPIVQDGFVDIELKNGIKKRINIQRIHIEQDAGKSIHDRYPDKTSVDFNRAGVGLMEIVSHPDMSSPEEAGAYVKVIRSILKAIDSSDADMEKGSMRIDANISVRLQGESKLGTRCEIKNLNSIKFLQTAVEFEARRHIEIIENSKEVEQETRLFDAVKIETRSMRKKEEANDYKYFPDPDLPPLRISNTFIEQIKSEMPELPQAKFIRYLSNGLSDSESKILSENSYYSAFFDSLCQTFDTKTSYTWMMVELMGRINKANLELDKISISVQDIAELIELIRSEKINGKIAKVVLDEMVDSALSGIKKSASTIVSEQGLEQIGGTDAIDAIVRSVLEKNPNQLESYRNGNQKLFGFFVGEVMKLTSGKANPANVNQILKKVLS